MDEREGEQQREPGALSQAIDPVAQLVVNADDPWDAYRSATGVSSSLPDDWADLPHGGEVYVVWAELCDLYAAGKTPIPQAHAALTRAASSWLARPGLPTGDFIAGWLKATADDTRSLVAKYGDTWTTPT